MSFGRMLLFFRRLPVRLGLIAVLFLVLVLLVHSLSLGSLADIDVTTSEIRNRWLESVRILGDLRHHVARVRTEEGEVLLGSSQDKVADVGRYLTLASGDIADYRAINHDPDELKSFESFASAWQAYLERNRMLMSLVASGKGSEAIAFYRGDASNAFHKAAHELRVLVDLTYGKAEAARARGRQAIATAQSVISDLILSIVAFFIAMAFYLWHSYSRPLLQLAGYMRRLALNDTNFKVPSEDRRDEIGEMAQSLAVLRRNMIELLETRKSLAIQANMLASTLAKERELTALQRNFVTTMSHEFRTPLTYIDGHAQRLIATRDHAVPAQVAERAEKIRSAVFQMTSLVASLTAEIEMFTLSGKPKKELFDPALMLRGLIGYYREIDLKVRFADHLEELPKIEGDPKLLRCAFSNLISNAMKYSGEGGVVEISAKDRDGAIEVMIADHGIGIPPAELQSVLERFYRASNAGSIPGSGVGLSLAQQILEQHGGQMTIESELGQGTRITVSLPTRSAETEDGAAHYEQNIMH